jgi:hypothetical protein
MVKIGFSVLVAYDEAHPRAMSVHLPG